MNNKEFITEVAQKLSVSNDQCQKMSYEFTDSLTNALEGGNEVIIAGLGCFEIKKKKERIMVNPSNGKKMLVPPKLSVSFKMSSTFKNKIN
jgi:DNA-binding protein HU-beta